MDGTVIEWADPDIRRAHDIVKRLAREAKHDLKELNVEIYKDGQYFACAWATPCGAGAIGFSGNRDTRSIELW